MTATPSNPVQSCQPNIFGLPGPCVICGATGYDLSCGGPTICPKCDCGQFDAVTVMTQAKRLATLTARVEELTFQLDTSRLSVHNAEVENDRRADQIEELLEIVEAIPGTPDEMPDEPCEDLCGNSWCNEFGCIANKIRDARAVLQPKGAV